MTPELYRMLLAKAENHDITMRQRHQVIVIGDLVLDYVSKLELTTFAMRGPEELVWVEDD